MMRADGDHYAKNFVPIFMRFILSALNVGFLLFLHHPTDSDIKVRCIILFIYIYKLTNDVLIYRSVA